ncbi:N-terminal nucleophile aminohydrolase [Lophium mytilinum]|uniref:N-terminal nucleophile aminohydrolase n=1 Tax=Lophium mytilinum TaxID=390894 RepID=A0A6A6QCG1_9PEZI|nr:N-terminal nucleophile aminohydrolase [Lophium mytilinum]
MCRFLVYKGKDEILLSKLILDPSHSILTQSYDSRLRLDRRRPHNGDGFGVGYYTSPALGPEPCIFTSTIPAWNCINLSRLASKTTSSLIFAHVRATTEGNLSDSNCHPFRYRSLMFMHNGGIGGWKHVKRRLAVSLSEQWFVNVQGSTDSEWAFALFLDSMERAGVSPDDERAASEGFGHIVLRKALLKTIERINAFIAEIPEALRTEDTRSLLNFAVTDGHSVVCTRYVSSCTDEAASLFFSSGTSWLEDLPASSPSASPSPPPSDPPAKTFRMARLDKSSSTILISSEPLTFDRDNWVTVPTNSVLTIHDQTLMIHPVRDQFYSANPAHERSAKFAETKGQMVTGPDKSVLIGEVGNKAQNGQLSPGRAGGCGDAKVDVVSGAIRRLRVE